MKNFKYLYLVVWSLTDAARNNICRHESLPLKGELAEQEDDEFSLVCCHATLWHAWSADHFSEDINTMHVKWIDISSQQQEFVNKLKLYVEKFEMREIIDKKIGEKKPKSRALTQKCF